MELINDDVELTAAEIYELTNNETPEKNESPVKKK